MLKKILKTTVAVATLMVGSQSWGATAYTSGSEYGDTRIDSVLFGTSAATVNYGGYTTPSVKVKKLVVNLTTNGSIGVSTTPTATTGVIPASVKEIWYRGEARGLNTIHGGVAANALPVPPANSIIHFDLVASPASSDVWFTDVLPTTCEIIIERGSADPLLPVTYYANVRKITIGRNLSIAAATFLGAIVRHPNVSAKDIAGLAQLTVTGNAVFKKSISGVKLVGGANNLTFDESATLPDPTGTGTVAIGSGKTLTIQNIDAMFDITALAGLTLGAKSKVVLEAK